VVCGERRALGVNSKLKDFGPMARHARSGADVITVGHGYLKQFMYYASDLMRAYLSSRAQRRSATPMAVRHTDFPRGEPRHQMLQIGILIRSLRDQGDGKLVAMHAGRRYSSKHCTIPVRAYAPGFIRVSPRRPSQRHTHESIRSLGGQREAGT